MEKKGIDISKWQGSPDWTKLAAAHRAGQLDFVIMRAGYGGGTIDPCFEANYAAARAAGIPVGAYWYAYWGSYTPSQEAANFLRAAAGKVLQYGLWYDVEYETAITSLAKSVRTDKVLEGLAALAASGRYVGLYASTDMVNNRLEYDRLRAYDLWCAQYGSVNTCRLPYGIWQYSSTGRIDGITGNVDCDRAYKDYPAFVVGPLAGESGTTAGGSTVDAPTPSPSPAPGQENQRPREARTWRVSGSGKTKTDALLAFCDRLGLYLVGGIDVRPKRGRAELLAAASELALGTNGDLSMSIGPATRGDLIRVLTEADKADLDASFVWSIGPTSTGDSDSLQRLCVELACSCEEVA